MQLNTQAVQALSVLLCLQVKIPNEGLASQMLVGPHSACDLVSLCSSRVRGKVAFVMVLLGVGRFKPKQYLNSLLVDGASQAATQRLCACKATFERVLTMKELQDGDYFDEPVEARQPVYMLQCLFAVMLLMSAS